MILGRLEAGWRCLFAVFRRAPFEIFMGGVAIHSKRCHGWRILSVQHAIPVALRTGILITAYGESKAAFVGMGWAEAPEPAKTLHRLLVEAVAGNPVVETRISPDQPKDKLAVTIAAKY